jgi:hypothetical protein
MQRRSLKNNEGISQTENVKRFETVEITSEDVHLVDSRNGKNPAELANAMSSRDLSRLRDQTVKSKVFYVEHFSVLRKGCHAKIFFSRALRWHGNATSRD